MSYFSGLQIDGGPIQPVGSSLFGTCSTPAATATKVVTLANFDSLVHGVTIHVKFLFGNNVDTDTALTLTVGTTLSKPVSNPGGSNTWAAGAVISFTYDANTDNGVWSVNDSDALKINTESVIKTANFTPDTPGTLVTKNTTVPNVTSTGVAASFSVVNSVLHISAGSAPTLGDALIIKEVDTWTPGTAASLNTTVQTVVVPTSS